MIERPVPDRPGWFMGTPVHCSKDGDQWIEATISQAVPETGSAKSFSIRFDGDPDNLDLVLQAQQWIDVWATE